MPADAWNEVTWREGSNTPLTSRFAALRVRPAAKHDKIGEPAPHEWLLVEWPEDEAEPTKYWLSTLPEDAPLATLVDIAKLRWRIERDYEELKSELGLGHFEGRGWQGVGERQRQRRALAARRTDCAEEIGVFIALVGRLARPRSASCPLPHKTVLLADARSKRVGSFFERLDDLRILTRMTRTRAHMREAKLLE